MQVSENPLVVRPVYPKVDIAGIPKQEILLALYEASKQRDLFANYEPLSVDDFMLLLSDVEGALRLNAVKSLRVDFLCGQVMMVDVGPDVLDLGEYDAHMGKGAGLRALARLLKEHKKEVQLLAEDADVIEARGPVMRVVRGRDLVVWSRKGIEVRQQGMHGGPCFTFEGLRPVENVKQAVEKGPLGF